MSFLSASKVLLYLFSAVLALGTWNPFLPFQFQEEEQSGFALYQIIVVLFVALLFFVPKNRKINNKDTKIYLIVLFLLVFLSTVFNSLSMMTVGTMIFFVKFALVLALCYLLPRLFTFSPELIFKSAFIFSIVCTILSIVYAFGYLDQFSEISKGRFYFWGENPNSTSARYGLAFLFILHIIIDNPLGLSKWRHLLWLSLPFLLNFIMASGSRGSFLILLISILTYLAFAPFRSKNYKWLLVFILSTGLLWGIEYIATNNQDYVLFERLNDSVEHGEDAGRDRLNGEAIQIFLDNPIYGVGVHDFQAEMKARFSEELTVHNLYVYLFAISGLLGGCCFLAFLLHLFKNAYVARRYTSLSLSLFIYMALLAYKTGGILTYSLMWYVFSIIISVAVFNKYDICESK